MVRKRHSREIGLEEVKTCFKRLTGDAIDYATIGKKVAGVYGILPWEIIISHGGFFLLGKREMVEQELEMIRRELKTPLRRLVYGVEDSQKLWVRYIKGFLQRHSYNDASYLHEREEAYNLMCRTIDTFETFTNLLVYYPWLELKGEEDCSSWSLGKLSEGYKRYWEGVKARLED